MKLKLKGNQTTYIALAVALLVLAYVFRDKIREALTGPSNKVRAKIPAKYGGVAELAADVNRDEQMGIGAEGAVVQELQRLLNIVILELDSLDINLLQMDGDYGERTNAAAMEIFGETELSLNEVQAYIDKGFPEDNEGVSTGLTAGDALGLEAFAADFSGEVLSGAGAAYATLDEFKAMSADERAADTVLFETYWSKARPAGTMQAEARGGNRYSRPLETEYNYTWWKEHGRRVKANK